jgi:transcriptional regulator with XRE-family HTH domain
VSTARHEQVMKLFATRLRRARAAAGFTSAQAFATRIGLDPHAYRKYERGEACATYATIIQICDNLGLSTSELLPAEADKKGRSSLLRAAQEPQTQRVVVKVSQEPSGEPQPVRVVYAKMRDAQQ